MPCLIVLYTINKCLLHCLYKLLYNVMLRVHDKSAFFCIYSMKPVNCVCKCTCAGGMKIFLMLDNNLVLRTAISNC